jgi:methionyl-tRNA formyltransferase
VNGTRVKALLCETVQAAGEPGTFLDDRLTVACGSGAVRLLRLQREGKGAMDAGAFLRGFAIARGARAE